MKNSTILHVNLKNHNYPIYIGQQLLNNAELLRKHVHGKQVMIVSNPNVAKLYMNQVRAAFADLQCDTVIIPDGEQYKNLSVLNEIFDALLEKKHLRSTTLIALGGGVVGDMTGFAAACYQRGVDFIQIPTTLLAQVDASIGGKTAVNHAKGKNMIGAFHQPRAVIIDTNTLQTLAEREFHAGLAEIIKAGLLKDVDFFAWLENHMQKIMTKDLEILSHAIKQACAIKVAIVTSDEKETTGTRALLNLGHTFGHAIEKIFNYQQWLHGEAVAVGLVLAGDLSQRLDWITTKESERIRKILLTAKLPTQLPKEIDYAKMMEAMSVDKKNIDAGLRLVLLKALGHAELVFNVPNDLIRATIEENKI